MADVAKIFVMLVSVSLCGLLIWMGLSYCLMYQKMLNLKEKSRGNKWPTD